MPTPCSACGGRCGQDSAECIYHGSGPQLQLVMPIKPASMLPAPTCDQPAEAPQGSES